MDVDPQVDAAAPAADQAQLMQELSELLGQTTDQPHNLRLLRHQIVLMAQLGMTDEAVEAAESLHDQAFVGEALWLKLINAKIESPPRPFTLDSFAELIDMFTKAETEYLSIQILERHARLVVALAGGLPPSGSGEEDFSKDEELTEFLSSDTVRETLRGLTKRANGLLSDSQRVWQPWIDWELAQLATASDAEKAEQMERVHEVYLERLRIPYSTIDETSSAYSTFCTQHCPDEYEQRLTQVTNVSQPAKIKWSQERRHGKSRVDFEEQLAYASDIGQQATVLLSYIDWETDPLATKKPKGKKGPQQDHELTAAVFERTVLLYANAANAAEEGSWTEGAESMAQSAEAYKTAEGTVWARYVDWMAANPPPDVDEDENEEEVRKISSRSTNACPFDGGLWARYILNLEEAREITQIEKAVEKAQELIIANAAPVSALVEVLYNHLSVLHRRYRDLEVDLEHPVFAKATEAIQAVDSAYPSGDPSLRLEKFFVAWAEAVGPELLPGVMMVIGEPNHSRTSSYQYTILCADARARIGEVEAAREHYTKAVGRRDLDWPEAVYDAFTLFENTYGTLETLREAKSQIGHEQQKLNRRRQKAAEAQAAQAAEQYQQQAAATVAESAPAAAPEPATDEPATGGTADVQMAEAETAPPAEPSTSVPEPKQDEEEPQLKRDRENTTVLVTGLREGTETDRVTRFFANCGAVRECTMVPGKETDSALVEFISADSVPAALERDHKKLDSSDIRVTMLWRSTLFVTNFSKDTDDAGIRNLFSQYGTILQTRWPSLKFAASRRFCYVTMDSPASAQSALVLDNFKPDDGYPISVKISDPAARQKRSDEANTKLFVGGLNAKTKEGSVRELFAKYGNIRSVKLGWDKEKRQCKGFAFVEMATETEAKAALALDGTPYHGHGLKVELSDPHFASKRANANRRKTGNVAQDGRARNERHARLLVLQSVPEGTQEALLQQGLAKSIPGLVRVELFARRGEAQVEVESAKTVGEIAMRSPTLSFAGAELAVKTWDEAQAERVAAQPKAASAGKGTQGTAAAAVPAAPATSLGFQPRIRKTAKALPKAYHVPKAVASEAPKPAGNQGQADFRAFMNQTNEARKKAAEAAGGKPAAVSAANAAAVSDANAATAPPGSPASGSSGTKRASDAEAEGSSKRPKTDGS